jgi:hypothetical protein
MGMAHRSIQVIAMDKKNLLVIHTFQVKSYTFKIVHYTVKNEFHDVL